MIRKPVSLLALAGAALFTCCNLAIAQTPMPPCLAVDASAPATCGTTTTNGAPLFLGNSMQGMTLVPFGNYGNGQYIKFVGTDNKYGNVLARYPASPWGGTASFTDSLQQIWQGTGPAVTTEAIATDSTVPADVSSQVLVSTMIAPYVSPNQDTYQIQPSTSVAQGMYYTSRWVWLQPDLAARGRFGFILLTEFKTADPAERFGIEVNQSWYSTPHWEVYHDDFSQSPTAFYQLTLMDPTGIATGNNGIGQTHAAPVPLGRWFRLEFACKRSDSTGQGWLWIALTDPASSDPALQAGVQVFAARGAFNYVDGSTTRTLGMNAAQPTKPINRIYLHGVYSDIARSSTSPFVIKMTDMEVYPGWPSNATAHPTDYQ